MNERAYPLAWPISWPRTPRELIKRAPFFASVRRQAQMGNSYNVRGQRSMEDCAIEVYRELERLGATGEIISTNVELRQDGMPYSNRKPPADAGAAVYFKVKKRDLVLAVDKWDRVEDNLWAIAKHIESLRGQARWGVGSVEMAFSGYRMLPGASTAPRAWHEVLGISVLATAEEIEAAFKERAPRCHPDTGGSHEAMVELSEARRRALEDRRGA